MSRRSPKRWTKPIHYGELRIDDLLLDDAGQMYRVTELAEPKFSRVFNDVLIERFRIVGLWNTNHASGNALTCHEVNAFNYGAWVWHSRFGCLIT